MMDKFTMIGFIFSLILSNQYDATVNSLSESCRIPVNQMRRILEVLFKDKLLKSGFYFQTDDEKDVHDDNIIDMLYSGSYDNVSICFEDIDFANVNSVKKHKNNIISYQYVLPLTAEEYVCAKNQYPELINKSNEGVFEMKLTVDSIPKEIIDKQNTIQDAIRDKKVISFRYKSPKLEKGDIIRCTPATVSYDLSTGIIYFIDTKDNKYRLDRIANKITDIGTSAKTTKYSEDPKQKYYWGVGNKDARKQENPVYVKLKIINITSNLITKIKNDTLFRKETGNLWQEGDCYYYEDQVLGLQDFRKWLRKYGASIIVLEPERLKKEIIEGANRTLSYYKILEDSDIADSED